MGEAQWRRFRRIMNAVADAPEEACPWIAERILRGERPIDRLPPAVFMRRLVAAAFSRPDPLAVFGL